MADHPLVMVLGHRLAIDGERAGLALRAAALAAGEELVAVDRGDIPALDAAERLVPLEPVGDVGEVGPQRRAAHAGIDPADGVNARGPTAHQAAQPPGDAQVPFQGVEAAAAGDEEDQPADEGGGRRDTGPSAGVGQGGEPSAQAEDLLGIGAEPSHHGAGASERGRPLLAAISCLRRRRAWRWCCETRSISRLTRRPLSTQRRVVSWRAGGM